MIKLDNEFPTAVDSSEPSKYPHGAFKNSTVQGAYNGTPITKNVMNDTLGFHEALLSIGNVTASGTPEAANSSQLVTAIKNIARVQACEAMTGDYKDGYGIQFFDRPSGVGASSQILTVGTVNQGVTLITNLFRMRLTCIPGCWYSNIEIRSRSVGATMAQGTPYVARCNARTSTNTQLVNGDVTNYAYGTSWTNTAINFIAGTSFIAEVGDYIEFIDNYNGVNSNDFYLASAVARGVHPPVAGW